MALMNDGETPADLPEEGVGAFAGLDEAWQAFRAGLATYLTTMVDADEEDHLILELPDPSPAADGTCPPYAQFAGFGEGQMIRAEIAGNVNLMPAHQLGPSDCEAMTRMGWSGNDPDSGPEGHNWYVERSIGEADEIADRVVTALRHHFGIAHPQLLTHQAWGPAADGLAVLGLCASGDVPVEVGTAGAVSPVRTGGNGPGEEGGSILDVLAVEPTDRDELLHIVESLLREKYGREPEVDDDGDFVLHHMGQKVWIQVRRDQPAVQVTARVAHGVHSRRATAVEIGLLNRDSLWVRWDLRGRDVWQTLVLPAMPFVPRHLDAMVGLFLDVMTSTRDDLAYRTGARVA